MKSSLVVPAFMLALAATPALAVVGGGDVTFTVKGAGNVVFSHEMHVSDMGQKCRECHPRIFLDSRRSKHVTMKAMGKGKSCGACHNGKKAFSVKGDCAKCHRK
uniref:Cytochrome c7-like domain-containing protein n=1 Tax=Geobacter metallireducens TaxID=28232 RepID=A0A831XLE4_GEOME